MIEENLHAKVQASENKLFLEVKEDSASLLILLNVILSQIAQKYDVINTPYPCSMIYAAYHTSFYLPSKT